MDSLGALENYIRQLARVVVGFSGGVDSALLAFVARQTLGGSNMIAVTGDSSTVPSQDKNFVAAFCLEHDIPHQFVLTEEYENPNYRANPENRCYFCKEELYQKLQTVAARFETPHILDGTNITDLEGHRPGFEALKRAGVLAPYVDLKINKETIRNIAASLNLEVATKPQGACLASRIPTGTPIDLEALRKIDAAENALRRLGIKQPRVRFHGALARLELKEGEWDVCIQKKRAITEALAALGFSWVTLDLKPYARKG